uniref:Uncharacterized protein n=1 Tax=Knipowitschia caucasica TaxID=637954 RepID=A0AAV2MHZ9_KNICA
MDEYHSSSHHQPLPALRPRSSARPAPQGTVRKATDILTPASNPNRASSTASGHLPCSSEGHRLRSVGGPGETCDHSLFQMEKPESALTDGGEEVQGLTGVGEEVQAFTDTGKEAQALTDRQGGPGPHRQS